MLRGCVATVLCLGILAAPAHAEVAHTVQPGETLWSIAAANNLTTRTVAAYNGLSEDAQVVLGSTIRVPTVAEGAAALAAGAPQPAAQQPATPSPPPLGAYVVQPGDTLSAIAARSGVEPGQIAFMNGLDPGGVLVAGTRIKLPTGAPGSTGAGGPTPTPPAPQSAPVAEPNPTQEVVTPAQVAEIAAAHGVPTSLATAIAYQESGLSNHWISSANARGVMQILPGTWDWVEQNLARRDLDPNSAVENIHAGVMYLGRLLTDAGGDERTAAAGYYQGPGSVSSRGLLPETEQYVSNVMALRPRFGGP
jgi:LysM repeat protein